MREGANDFVLASAASATPSGQTGNLFDGVTGSTSTGATGTSGSSSPFPASGLGAVGSKYRLSGERDLVEYVGQRVEIVGRMDANAATTGAKGKDPARTELGTPGLAKPETGAGTPGTGTSAAGATSDSTPGPTGSQSAARSAATPPMPHVTITSVRAVGGTCQ
jgi:hypothetical protein